MEDPETPVLSAVVIARDDEDVIERSLRAVVDQRCPFPFEVIAVVSGDDRTADIVREKFPAVRLVKLPRPALPGEARNAGVRVARGRYVTFPGSHIELLPGSLAARVRVHERGYPMVSGVISNGTRTAAGWASYFLDHSANLPAAPSAELVGAPSQCSYEREVLRSAGAFREDLRAVEDTAMNVTLWKRGLRAYRSNEIGMIHYSPCTTTPRLLHHHKARGRSMGRLLLDPATSPWGAGSRRRALLWLAKYVPMRIVQTTRNVRRYGDPALRRRYRRAVPLVVAATFSSWFGAIDEVLSARAQKEGIGRA